MEDKEAIMMALLEAMEDGGGSVKESLRPKKRPKTIGGGMTDGTRGPKPMRKNIGSSASGSTRGIDPRDNYSAEDLKALLKSSGSAKGMMGGGKVKGYKGGGCVMPGRGGSYGGQS